MAQSTEILLYTPKNTPRIEYIFKHIIQRVLGYKLTFTDSVETFIAFQHAKFSYAQKPLGSEFFIEKSGLLDEVGFSDLDIKLSDWDGLPCFFKVADDKSLDFDIFSASFYLLSRYEEYQPFVKDIHGAFPVEESLAFKNNFLHLPLVDMWAEKFLYLLQERFPKLPDVPKKYQKHVLVNVSKAYAYANKNLFRQTAGWFKDLLSFRFKELYTRSLVYLNLKEDPLDTHKDILSWISKNSLESIWFFQLGDFTRASRNISHNRIAYHHLIKEINDYTSLGLLFSRHATSKAAVAIQEKKRMEEISHEKLDSSFISDPSLGFPEFYNTLESLNIRNDYSMGYTHQVGFKASTCNEFMFYDLNLERATALKIHPYVVDFKNVNFKNKNVLEQIKIINKIIQNLKGNFRVVIENTTFVNEHQQNFKSFFKHLDE